ncbi:hypothetical protein EMIT0324P_11152 [Pseudomonas chlororaphis]
MVAPVCLLYCPRPIFFIGEINSQAPLSKLDTLQTHTDPT